MKSLKLVLVSVSLSLCAVAASAQESSAPATQAATVAQNAQPGNAHRADLSSAKEVRGTRKADDCVGPVSFCNIYFGS